jgi:CheY-like chemotaxis protein
MTALSRKILYVDDEELQGKLMQRMLTRMGYDAKVAQDAKEALEILDNEEFLVIITDLSMPEMNGIELCKQIRKFNSESFIYAFSGYLAEFDFEKLEEYGFDGHLSKPSEIEFLKCAIEGAFEKVVRRRGRLSAKP